MHEFIDAYAELGVSPTAEQADLTAAYRTLARRRHPDAVEPEQRSQATARMQQLNLAYGLVAEPDARRAYDRVRRAHRAGVFRQTEREWENLLRRAGRWVGGRRARRGGVAYRLGLLTGRWLGGQVKP